MNGLPPGAGWTYLALLLVFVSKSIFQVTGENQHPAASRSSLWIAEVTNNTCSSGDLDHSLLVECATDSCEGVAGPTKANSAPLWPRTRDEVVHMFSTRAGARFGIKTLDRLNLVEDEDASLYNINTTMYVKTSDRGQEIAGFGTTIDLGQLSAAQSVESELGPILRDLFGTTGLGIKLTILRVRLTASLMSQEFRIVALLNELGTMLAKVPLGGLNQKIRVIFAVEDMKDFRDIIVALKRVMTGIESSNSLECWAVSIDKSLTTVVEEQFIKLDDIRDVPSSRNLFVAASHTEAPKFIEQIANNEVISNITGLIISRDYSAGYSALKLIIGSLSPNLKILSLGSEQLTSTTYGDWQLASNHAIQIIRLLQYGSHAFIETNSILDILKQPEDDRPDAGIYSIRPSHEVHFRGPMLYATGHFSQHVLPNSALLLSDIDTQPNMFAAHYIGFLTPDGHIVALVVNDNEHLLPYRLAIDGVVSAQVYLEPKSFNTIIVKI